MGACATKPKVLKTDSGEAPPPEPAPETGKEEAAVGGNVSETKMENGSDDRATEIVDDDKVGSKPGSLSHLFKQNEGKGSDENEKTAPDQPEKQEISENEKPLQPLEEKACDRDEVETERVIETAPEEKKVETKKENEPENREAFEEERVDVANDLEKAETTSEKGTEAEPASAAPTKGRSEDHKEEVKVSPEEKVGI